VNRPDHDPRVLLQRLIAERDSAKKRFSQDEAAVETAAILMERRQAELDRCDVAVRDCEERATIAAADAIKAMAEAGTPPTPPNCTNENDDVLARRREQIVSREGLAAAKAAHDRLILALRSSDKALATAAANAAAAALTVIAREAEKQAALLREVWTLTWVHYDLLTSFIDGMRATGTQLPPAAVRLFQQIASFDHRQHPGGRNVAVAEGMRKWRQWYDRLLVDPAAKFPATAERDRAA
jgi:hypothetical protein